MMSKYLILLITFLSLPSFASDYLTGTKLLFKYEGEQHYNVSFEKETVHWECIKGEELGKTETDLYKSAKISNDAFFIQWQEADGTFVALTFNLKTMKVVSTGIYKNYKWFRSGEVVNLNTRVQSKSTKNENSYWCKYGCTSTGVTTIEKGSTPLAACHISYAKCYNSCVDEDNYYAGCKYIEHGTILNTDK